MSMLQVSCLFSHSNQHITSLPNTQKIHQKIPQSTLSNYQHQPVSIMHFSTILISTAALAGLTLSTPLNGPVTGNANSLNRRQTVPPPFGGSCPDGEGVCNRPSSQEQCAAYKNQDCCFGIPALNPNDCRQCSSGQKCCNTAHGDVSIVSVCCVPSLSD